MGTDAEIPSGISRLAIATAIIVPRAAFPVVVLQKVTSPSRLPIYNYPEQSRQEYDGAKEANAYPDDGDKSQEPH